MLPVFCVRVCVPRCMRGGDLKLGLPARTGFASHGHVLEQVFRKLAGNLEDPQADHRRRQRLRSK